ncbi:MAG: MBL fold metallo-hydrolase [Desulfobacteraceae bacterium]|nr:MBL fold metallo-hydrolase [Desulfobacteraceae bacterium]MBC2751698.1 MBL fold metallo-hydrolase [Desulfobacteraceae bacterium]
MGASPIAITILVDNQAGPGLTTEHGFSLWIEADGRHILFDTGQGPALPVNARTLGVDLRQTDMVVLSHGHYDHTGGIPHVLHVAPNAHVYCHPAVVQPRYSLRNGSPKPAHMPSESMAALDRLPEKHLRWTSETVMLSENIGLTGPIPRQTTFEDTGGAFFLDPEARHADPIEDDLALWIKTDQGLVVCVGCCHAGIINTLTHVRRLSGVAPIRAVIGGLHLLNADSRRLNHTLADMQTMPIETVIPCHCTGDRALDELEAVMGAKTRRSRSGATHHF